ncbi:hypothetical protein AB0J83_45820 [Actinoplanes sp. NPDC049596]|uniref:hypothetical protein n=1 Tax=unclassified Actinoplanes TaxID=2626549 RepID=UPI0034229BD3
MTKRRYVARGVPGGYRIWDIKAGRWWGESYELYPAELLAQLNGPRDRERIIALMREYRAHKR